MKTILITAYAVNPYKGSEDGMGWNFIVQAARFNHVIAVTRKNNRDAIERFIQLNKENKNYNNINFIYVDVPNWMLFWKKGPLLSMIYYLFWQFIVTVKTLRLKNKIDIVHNLNFHNDWSPSFLWMFRKPMVWGPIGHHPKIDKTFLEKYYPFSALVKDRFLWCLKNIFWKFDPFLYLTKKYSTHIFCMNSGVAKVLNLNPEKYSIMPSVATENNLQDQNITKEKFTVLCAGRFEPVKNFDLALHAFARFYHTLHKNEQDKVCLKLIGKGKYLNVLQQIITELKIQDAVEIIDWVTHQEMKEYYSNASVFLFPSHEGAGMVVAEAQSFGLPVICWNNVGPGELVSAKSTLKINNNTYHYGVELFYHKLESLYKKPEFYAKEKKLALQNFQDKLMWNVRGEQLNKVYQQIISTQ